MSENLAVPTDLHPVVNEKQSPLKKYIVNPIKKHPKIATAIGLGVALVAGAAYFGKEEILPAPDDTVEIINHEDGSFTVQSTEES